MKNLAQMMKQAQHLQERMQTMQAELESTEIEGASGGGMIRVTLNGKGEAKRVKIDPSMVQADETEILEDLILAAINDAKAKVEQTAQQKMKELTGGLTLPPGFQLPF